MLTSIHATQLGDVTVWETDSIQIDVCEGFLDPSIGRRMITGALEITGSPEARAEVLARWAEAEGFQLVKIHKPSAFEQPPQREIPAETRNVATVSTDQVKRRTTVPPPPPPAAESRKDAASSDTRTRTTTGGSKQRDTGGYL